MRKRQRVGLVAAAAVFAVIVTAGKLIHAAHVEAGNDDDERDSRVEQGLAIARVPGELILWQVLSAM